LLVLSACGTYLPALLREDRLEPRQPNAAADHRHAGPVVAQQRLGVAYEVVGDVVPSALIHAARERRSLCDLLQRDWS